MRRTSLLLGAFLLLLAEPARAGGPLIIYNVATRTPWAYGAAAVSVYTDLGNMGSVLTNAEADAIVTTSFASWTGVASAFFSAAVVGDFGSIGLPDIVHTNAGLVVGTNNGGGIHVIYDNTGQIFTNFFGTPPGVLGIASPDFGNTMTGILTESWAVLNGTQVAVTDPVGAHFAGVFTHELGHAINLAHTQTNGGIIFFGDATAPPSCALPYIGSPTFAQTETMYPFIDPTPGSVGDDMATVDQLDDVAALSNIYPTGGYPGNRATINGTVYLSDGVTQVSGVNVIARNQANPFGNCISALSGDYTQGAAGPDGLYRFNGLTGGANYVVYIDGIVAGGFSTPPVGVSGAAEEFYNGVSESGDPAVDNRCSFTLLAAAVGSPITANVIVNEPYVLLDDDASFEVDLPFPFPFCDVVYNSVFVGANGFLTFGAGDTDYTQSVGEFLGGAPRIAALWCDLSPQLGTVTAQEVGGNFEIAFIDVPLFNTSNSNNFVITLRPNGTYSIVYGVVDVTSALVGRTPGGGAANPGETNLSSAAQPFAASTVYENFTAGDFDLDARTLEFTTCGNPCLVNQPPIAVCQDVEVEGDVESCEAAVLASQVNNGSSDPNGMINSMVLVPAGPFGSGETGVLLIVTDNCGVSDSCSATITVTCPDTCAGNLPPEALCQNVEVLGDSTGCEVNVSAAQVNDGSSDPDGIIASSILVPAGPYPEGVTNVLLIVTDDCNASDTCSATITVTCPEGPVLEVTPASILFPGQAQGDTICGSVVVRNIGDQDLDISSITGCSSDGFFLDTSTAAVTLEPGDSTSFLVCYSTTGAGNDSCTVTVASNAGNSDVSVSVGHTIGIPDDAILGNGLVLAPVVPNPSSEAAELRFALPAASRVDLAIYNLQGRIVRSMLRGDERSEGEHRLRWDGADERGNPVAAGLYFIRLTTETDMRVVRAIRTR